MMLSRGAVIAGRYEIVEKIGVGGMAIVYRAKDKKLDRDVTFKVMREEFVTDEEFKSRFAIEARASASLANQNIVNVYDVGQEGHIHYIVMEYIDGVTLKDLIVRRAPFDNDEVLGVSIQIAQALEHAHKHNIIHRDIKPQNILVTTTGTVKVTDFGIARAVTENTTSTGSNTMGSVHYFSPEQARGGYVDNKSDIYALGIVMYEMVTGKLPFDGETAIAVALKHINDQLPDIKEINSNVSDAVIKIIVKATEKQSSNRFQTIAEMTNELKRALTNTSGEFISTHAALIESHTIKLTPEDVLQIQKESKVKNYLYDDDYDETQFDDMYEDVHDKALERKVVIGAVLTGIVLIVIISLVFLFYKKPRTVDVEPVSIPTIIGMDWEEAGKLGEELGIFFKVADEVYNDEIPAGAIYSADIEGEVYPGDTIEIVLSLGTDKFEVPEVTKLDYNQAIAELESIGIFNINKVWNNDESFAKNIVMSQQPKAGELVARGEAVTITISKGPKLKTVLMPNIIGDMDADAIQKIQGVKLIVGQKEWADHETAPRGQVIYQSVKAGNEVQEGTVVTYTLSTGEKPAPSPAPEVSETPAPTPKGVTKPLMVDPSIPEGVETVHLRIIEFRGGEPRTFFDEVVSIDFFPQVFNITGTDVSEFHIYFVDDNGNSALQATTQLTFTEGTEQ